MKLFFWRLGKTFLLAFMWAIFFISIIYWKIAKRLKPSKKDEYEANAIKCLFCGLVPVMYDFDKTWNVNWLGGP